MIITTDHRGLPEIEGFLRTSPHAVLKLCGETPFVSRKIVAGRHVERYYRDGRLVGMAVEAPGLFDGWVALRPIGS
jgi:hypothetical protein